MTAASTTVENNMMLFVALMVLAEQLDDGDGDGCSY